MLLEVPPLYGGKAPPFVDQVGTGHANYQYNYADANTNCNVGSKLRFLRLACASVSVASCLVRASAPESSRSVDAGTRNRARVLDSTIAALVNISAAALQVWVALVPTRAVAEISRAVSRIHAPAVAADAGVGRGVPHRLPARHLPYHPVEHQRHLPAGGRHEVAGGDVGGAEVEPRRLDQDRVAAPAEVSDRGGVELLLKHHVVRVDPPGDGRLAAAHAGAGAVLQPAGARARGHAPGHVRGARRELGRVLGAHVGERVAPDHGEPVVLVGQHEGRVGEVCPHAAPPVHGPGRGVVAPRVDLVADARLPAGHGHAQDLDLEAEGPVGAVGGEVAGEAEGHVVLARVEVAAAADAERVRDVHVAAPPLACSARWLRCRCRRGPRRSEHGDQDKKHLCSLRGEPAC